MAGLVPAIYVFGRPRGKDVDTRVKPAHDGGRKPPSQASTMIKVIKLKRLSGYRLHVTFSDGTAGEHDFSVLVAEAGPMGEPLRDPAYFARVFLEDGAPTWPNSFDMDAEWLRREIEAMGGLTRDAAA
jgi:Protein of unknown function (DUF2442)